MKFHLLITALTLGATTGTASPLTWPHRIPTPHESAILARRLLALTPLASFATVYPTSSGDPSIAGLPTTMMDYIAHCEDSGNPTLLKLDIGTTFRNAAAGSNVTVSLRWVPPYPPAKRISMGESLLNWVGLGLRSAGAKDDDEKEKVPYSAANMPRVALMGYIEPIGAGEANYIELAKCFVQTHPDAKYWLPGNPIHRASWARLVVEKIYWVGGFGDRAYIGWIDKEDYEGVTREEWGKVRLPGEKPGWSEWAVEEVQEEI